MGEQISDRYNPSQQLRVEKDGSILIKQTDGETELDLTELKNLEILDLLNKIYKEIKKVNLHLSLLTEEYIRNEDV